MNSAKVRFQTIDEYIESFPVNIQKRMQQMRDTIRTAVPDAGEKISYNMPTFTLNGKYLVYFAGWKNHLAFYGAPRGHAEFKEDLAGYETGQGTLQFPYEKPLPLDLIAKIAKFRATQIRKKSGGKKQRTGSHDTK